MICVINLNNIGFYVLFTWLPAFLSNARYWCEASSCRWLDGDDDSGAAWAANGRPKLLITPIFRDFSRFFPVFPGAFGRAPWIPGVQTLKMGERWGKMGKKWVKSEITGVQKTALMHASAGLAGPHGPIGRGYR